MKHHDYMSRERHVAILRAPAVQMYERAVQTTVRFIAFTEAKSMCGHKNPYDADSGSVTVDYGEQEQLQWGV